MDKKEIEEVANEHSLFYDLLIELKRTRSRLKIALATTLILWLATICGFILYIQH